MSVILAALLFLNYNVGITNAKSRCHYIYYYNNYYCDYYYTYYDSSYYTSLTSVSHKVNLGAILGGVFGGIFGIGLLVTIIKIVCVYANKSKTTPVSVMPRTQVVSSVQTSGGHSTQTMMYPQSIPAKQQIFQVQHA